jgi:hypothetical protein
VAQHREDLYIRFPMTFLQTSDLNMEANYTKLSPSVRVPCHVDKMSVGQNFAYRMHTEGEGSIQLTSLYY